MPCRYCDKNCEGAHLAVEQGRLLIVNQVNRSGLKRKTRAVYICCIVGTMRERYGEAIADRFYEIVKTTIDRKTLETINEIQGLPVVKEVAEYMAQHGFKEWKTRIGLV